MNMAKFHIKRAQVTIEYAMVAACIVAAFLMMQHYIRRAAQGRLREAADSIGGQYDPRHINSQITFTQSGTTRTESVQVREPSVDAEEGVIDGVRTTITTTNENVNRTGYEESQAFPAGLFD